MRTVNTRRLIPLLYTCDVTYGKNYILRYFAYSLSRRCWVWGPYDPKIHPRTAKLNWFSVTVFLTSAISRILRIHEMKKLLDLDRFELVNTLQPHRKVVENSFWCQNKGINISRCWLVFGHTPTQSSRSKVKKTSFFRVFKVQPNFFVFKVHKKYFFWMRTVSTRRLIPHLYTSSVTCDVTYGKNDILRYFAYSLSRRYWVWGPYVH